MTDYYKHVRLLDPADLTRTLDYETALRVARERYGKPFRSLSLAPRVEPPSRKLIELVNASEPLVIVPGKREAK